MAQRNQQLKEANDAKLQIFSIISHDLKGPLATLRGILNSVEEGFSTPEKAQRQLAHLKTMMAPLNNTLNNLLLWSRQQLEGFNTAPEELCLDEIIREEISLAGEEAQICNIIIQNNIPAQTKVIADINQLRVVFRNLISNAIHHAEPNSVVALSATLAKHEITFRVSNTGTLIPADVANEFNQTGRLTAAAFTKKQSGLGLQLCRTFVIGNGGKLWIAIEEKQKTVFCFTVRSPQTTVTA